MTGAPSPRAAIVGIAGPTLTPEERALLAALPPAGVILFQRNCQDPAQLRALTDAIRALLPDRPPLLFIDQEGGRVMRLKPPSWRPLPAAAAVAGCAEPEAAEAARLLGTLIGRDLRAAGIDVDCAPVLDVAGAGMTEAIGSRSFGRAPERVATLARSFMAGLESQGVAPVIKHMPGHGRAVVDSHLSLPVVTAPIEELRRIDFVPFAALREAPFAMTAHIVFTAIDPVLPATTSPKVISEIMRGEIGFSGILLSDDLAMQALSGGPGARASAALAAGCDLALYCTGRLEETAAVLRAAPPLDAGTVLRLEAVRARLKAAVPAVCDAEADQLRLASLTGLSGGPLA